MSKDSDPRFRNSKFLDFLKKVQTGEYELSNENTLVVHPEMAQATADLDAKLNAMNTEWS
jgi:peroxin-5